MYKKTTLKNGLKIITVPQKDTKALTVLILVGTGSKYETKSQSGISHFLEHLLFKGTQKRPTPISIAEPLDAVGGIFNAFTSEEYTGFFIKAAAKNFDLALDVISDIYQNSKLDDTELQKEKGVIIEEINMTYDHPMSYVQTLWHKVLYGDQPAGWDIAGTKESVSGLSRQDLANYMNSQYTASNTIVCLAGNIPDKTALNKIKKSFANIRTQKYAEKVKVVEKQTEPQVLLQKKETDQTHLCLGFRGYDAFHPQKYAQEVLAAALGGMMSSRLFVRIREELGLAYYISAGSSDFTDSGYLVTQAGVDNKKVELAITAILGEYKRILKDGIPAEELKKAKENIIGKMTLMLESSDAQASFYGLQEILEKRILTAEQIYAKINKVSAQDIAKVAKDLFVGSKLNLALIGPFEDKEKFKKLLHI